MKTILLSLLLIVSTFAFSQANNPGFSNTSGGDPNNPNTGQGGLLQNPTYPASGASNNFCVVVTLNGSNQCVLDSGVDPGSTHVPGPWDNSGNTSSDALGAFGPLGSGPGGHTGGSPIPGTTFSNSLPHLGYRDLFSGVWNNIKDFANSVYMSNIHPDQYYKPGSLVIGIANPVEFGPVRYLEGDELIDASRRVIYNLHPEADPNSLLKDKNLLHTQMTLEDGYLREMQSLQNATEDWINAGTEEDSLRAAQAMRAHAVNHRMIEGALNKLVWTFRLSGPMTH